MLKFTGNFFNKFRLLKYRKLIRNSGLFDMQYYLKTNPDVKMQGWDPIRHFLLYGAGELRNPSADFNTAFYLETYPDVTINPLIHFILHGKAEHRNTKPDFNPLNSVLQSVSLTIKPPENKTGKYSLLKELEIIKESGFFDGGYYLKMYQDVRNSGIDPLEHFCKFGWKEMRNPNPEFDVYYYLQSNPDVVRFGMNPLVHYCRFGKSENRLTKEITINARDCLKRADISQISITGPVPSGFRMAVVFHVFYPELIDEFAGYLRNIKHPFDLFISTTSDNEEAVINLIKSELGLEPVVFIFENKGRDIGPFIEIFKHELTRYNLVLKVHTKKSLHNYNLRRWKTFILDNLIGSPEIADTIISNFCGNSSLGMVFPLPHPYLVHIGLDKGWGKNDYSIAEGVFNTIDFEKYREGNFSFPAGSMFWFRPEALSQIISSGVGISNFDQGTGKEDGTFAHLMERMFGIFAVEAGFEVKSAWFGNEVKNNKLKPANWLKESKTVLFISHDLFRAGAEMILFNIVYWFRKYTGINTIVVSVRLGGDGGKMRGYFENITPVYIWQELILKMPENEIPSFLEKKHGPISLIYGNTIQSPILYKFFSDLKIPYITHIHELEKSIMKYASADAIEALHNSNGKIIACSKPVKENMITNHKVEEKDIDLVYEFVEPDRFDLEKTIMLRKSVRLNETHVTVWGCGAIYWRKGVDIFIETAKRLKDIGTLDFCFCWIGGNYWKDETKTYGTWEFWEQYIIDHQLQDHVVFLGEQDYARRFYKKGDIFFLPSREDPFPLVCLEAAEKQLPVVCYEGAGGMPEFVEEDAGVIVPYLDMDKTAEAIFKLIENKPKRIELGENARKKFLRSFTTDISVPKILKVCREAMGVKPYVSVIIPVYNQELFLPERIESVLKQTYRDFEILIIDDCSTDRSYEIALGYASHPAVRVIRNEKNSGSVFKQWKKGMDMAAGNLIWVAEGDDVADPLFLETLVPAFNDPGIGLSYCASHTIDENGNTGLEHYLKTGHYRNLLFPEERWAADYTESGVIEVLNALAIRNTIPNASGVLVRKEALGAVDFDFCGNFTTTGDWFIYAEVLKSKSVFYSSKHLNFHRIHSSSVVGAGKKDAGLTLTDYFNMHSYLIENFPVKKQQIDLMLNTVRGLKGLWKDIPDGELGRFYSKKQLYEVFEKKKY